jgi:hypothetical protein
MEIVGQLSQGTVPLLPGLEAFSAFLEMQKHYDFLVKQA